jgi:3-oxoadipate enol-lactonase
LSSLAADVFVEGPDCRLWVEVHGEGAPVTVFAHGVTSSVAELEPLAARAPGTRLLFDFRGHGHSDSPPEEAGYDHRAMRRDLEAVADAFDASMGFGVSMGAEALLAVLADKPDRFERLVFFLPSSIDTTSTETSALADLLETYPLEEVVARTIQDPAQEQLFARRPYWRSLWRERILRMNSTGVPRALRAYAGSLPVEDAEALRNVEAPALVLGHAGDPIHDEKVARRLAELLPKATLKIWPETLAMYDDVDAFASLIGEFLGGNTSR